MTVHRFSGSLASLDAALAERRALSSEFWRSQAHVRARVYAHRASKARPMVWARFGAWALLAFGVCFGLLLAIAGFYLVLIWREARIGAFGLAAGVLATKALRSFEAL